MKATFKTAYEYFEENNLDNSNDEQYFYIANILSCDAAKEILSISFVDESHIDSQRRIREKLINEYEKKFNTKYIE
ncbi:hypothetical protein [Tenacibaculum aiptasiae]|uniref:hypothetical protein n=1 Tax=Tenacibaculum aiptasiae TaxID=426481 RepID=UPI0023305841|nr:hypothetical protein [Tenacibaculum aiptasiae]